MAVPVPRKILVPVDFSHHADSAVDYALELARAFGAQVDVLHVFRRPVEIFSPYELALPPSVTEDLQAAVRRQLDVAHQKVKEAGLDGAALVREGDPATIIADEARAGHGPHRDGHARARGPEARAHGLGGRARPAHGALPRAHRT